MRLLSGSDVSTSTKVEQTITNGLGGGLDSSILGIGDSPSLMGSPLADRQRFEAEKKLKEAQITGERRKLEEEKRLREMQIEADKKKIDEEKARQQLQADEQRRRVEDQRRTQ